MAEDYISTRGLLSAYARHTGLGLDNVEALAIRAQTGADQVAVSVFSTFGMYLGHVLEPWIQAFQPDYVVLGGSIRKAASLFLPSLQSTLSVAGLQTPVYLSDRIEFAALEGAAGLLEDAPESAADPSDRPAIVSGSWRKTTQPLMPAHADPPPAAYDRYPFHALGDGQISHGYESLAAWIATHPKVRIDGYGGNDWDAIRTHLGAALRRQGKRVAWFDTASFLKNPQEILDLTAPFMGEAGSVWGKLTDLELGDFFRMDSLERVQSDFALSIGLGIGAALLSWDAPVVYIDLPKNEIQYRMRAGSTANLGFGKPSVPTEMYKRCYFIDWVVLNRHRARIMDRIAAVADGQWRDDITWAGKDAITEGLRKMASSTIRVRPWFEAGAWGGQWLKSHIPGLPAEEVNYAWSFELIVPENGLVFESSGFLLEVGFEWLMEREAAAVLGVDARRFGTEFPIRFDFLDTFDGGNLSIQCHPTIDYIREQFGERITQDETYYILDCTEDAGVYLGFQEDIDPHAFREALETSHTSGKPVEIDRYVQRHPARRHDLFLIPNSTIHSAGKNNLVLEISATPYIYTFKMYDWLRLDLNGEPRPINIGHAFHNLDFERKGERVTRELLSRPAVLEQKENYRLLHLPTHPVHFYDVHRIEFTGSVTVSTADQCHVLMVVEGASVWVETSLSEKKRFYYAETFVIPAAAGAYTLHTEEGIPVKVVKAFIKPAARTT
jgi:mannose-6-phosphate isomerase class I